LTERRSPIPALPVTALREVGGEHGVSHAIATLDDGSAAFIKSGSAGGFEAEANGLRWLEVDGGAPAPAVLAVGDGYLAIDYLPPGHPSPEAAERFGAELAVTHAAGAPVFGAPWPGWIAAPGPRLPLRRQLPKRPPSSRPRRPGHLTRPRHEGHR
jgi:fructosamine-3-kinase